LWPCTFACAGRVLGDAQLDIHATKESAQTKHAMPRKHPFSTLLVVAPLVIPRAASSWNVAR